MGVWGSGNLDSDGTLDIVGERSDELIERLWTAIKDTYSAEADESAHDELFVDLEWLFALEAGGCFNGWKLPAVSELEPVLEAWLAHWSGYFDGLSGPEFKAERRAVIEQTFERLRVICAEYERQRAEIS
ncbi:MAG: hypothetical protein JXR96_24975 [Deltaproteobacteria bacterium]|nr:hypothetical protein [Deltaproteobacteria bacterium]